MKLQLSVLLICLPALLGFFFSSDQECRIHYQSLKEIQIAWDQAFFAPDLTTPKKLIQSQPCYEELDQLEKVEHLDRSLTDWPMTRAERQVNPEYLALRGIIRSSLANFTANTLSAMDLFHQGVQWLEQAITMDPNILNGLALSKLAEAISKVPSSVSSKANPQKAGELFRQALAINPSSKEINYEYALFLTNFSDLRPNNIEPIVYITKCTQGVPPGNIDFAGSLAIEKAKEMLADF